jgi:poly(A) polymerase
MLNIIKKLQNNGFEAYLVGGCVRDKLLNKNPKDFDIATSATPQQVISLFERTEPVGVSFGVVLVIENDIPYEVATFRSDGVYSDNRRPDSILFSTPEEDAKRRDFTINALFYDPFKNKIIDFVNGQEDLNNKIIKTVGNPIDRFNEDRLRVLRAIRFNITLGFEIEQKTKEAMFNVSLDGLAWERIEKELSRMLMHNALKTIKVLDEFGILEKLLPELIKMKGVEQSKNWHPEGDVWNHTLKSISFLNNPTKELAWATLLHDVGKPNKQIFDGEKIKFKGHELLGADMAEIICDRFKMSVESKERIKNLIKSHMKATDSINFRKSKLIKLLREDFIDELIELHFCDCMGSDGNLECYEFLKNKKNELKEDIKPKIKLITGKDLIDLGFKPGPIFREILEKIEDLQLENEISTKEEAMEVVKTYAIH